MHAYSRMIMNKMKAEDNIKNKTKTKTSNWFVAWLRMTSEFFHLLATFLDLKKAVPDLSLFFFVFFFFHLIV